MIVRLWRGSVPAARAEEYRAYQEEVGPPGYRAIPGVRRIYMLGREVGELYEIAMLTHWDSLDAIRAFAGDPIDQARYYDRDFDFLVDPPEKVEHFEVLASANTIDQPGCPPERIVRLWHRGVPLERWDEARRLESDVGVRAYATLPGNRGVYLVGRERGLEYELVTVTLWDSLDAICAFAGDPVYRRRGFDGLCEAPEAVEHFTVLFRMVVGGAG